MDERTTQSYEDEIKTLRKEQAERRITNEKLATDLESMKNQLAEIKNVEKQKEEEESKKKGDYQLLLEKKEARIRELTQIVKDHETKLMVYESAEKQEIEELKTKIPENLRTSFESINDKKALRAIVENLSTMKVNNSLLSEDDKILSMAKTNPKELTLEQQATWSKLDPTGYNEHVRTQLAIRK